VWHGAQRHQLLEPIEQLMSLRAMPHLNLIRPADANETVEAWALALESEDPVGLVLSRQKLPIFDRRSCASADGVRKGAYVIRDTSKSTPEIILIATGSEVWVALDAQEALEKSGIATRVVSMPSFYLFEQQSQSYRDEVLPPKVRARLSIEAGATLGWERYVGDGGASLGVDHFGASAPGETVLEKMGFTAENVVSLAESLLKDAETTRHELWKFTHTSELEKA